MKKAFMLLALAMAAMTAGAYDLTVGTSKHGELTFKVGENTVTTARAYSETQTSTFFISPRDLSSEMVRPVTGITYAGTATLTVTATAANNNFSGSASKTFSILKADAAVTAQTAREGLAYTAEPQALLNAGTAEGGEMQYSLDGAEYGPAVSTATGAGEYTVYYRVAGDRNHNDAAPQALTVTIAKAALTAVTLAESTFTYNREEQTAQVAAVSAGTVAVSAADYEVTGNTATGAGDYTATVTARAGSANFTGSATARYSIVPADARTFTLTLAPGASVFTDGRWLLFTLGEWGTFHIWHHDADLWLMDLNTGEARPLEAANSDDTESYHSWSSNGRWVVFSSRRYDGVFTRPFIAHVDEHGQASKPFELPAQDPDYHRQLMKSYNVPELMTGRVALAPQQVARVLKQAGKPVGYDCDK